MFFPAWPACSDSVTSWHLMADPGCHAILRKTCRSSLSLASLVGRRQSSAQHLDSGIREGSCSFHLTVANRLYLFKMQAISKSTHSTCCRSLLAPSIAVVPAAVNVSKNENSGDLAQRAETQRRTQKAPPRSATATAGRGLKHERSLSSSGRSTPDFG